MLGSRVGVVARQTARPVQGVQSRTVVTAAVLRTRIRSVKNVKKITGVMKMVAASKLRNAQRVLGISRAFEKDVMGVWPDQKVPEGPKKVLFAGVTSDAGLCGGVNSAVVRMIKREAIPLKKNGVEVSVVCYGNKAVSGLSRELSNSMSETYTEIGKLKFLTFRQVCGLAAPLLTHEYDECKVAYNIFRNSVSYDTTTATLLPLETAVGDGKFMEMYEVEGDTDCIRNFYEFRTAVRLFNFFSESETSTLSSRMNAMENSSRNAGDMISKLSLVLNRTRQARITTELIEIISGAVAAEEMQNK